MPGLIVAWVAAGGLVGAVLGVAARRLTADDAERPDLPPLATRHSPLATAALATRHSPFATFIPDPPLQATTALVFGLLAWQAGSSGLTLALAVHSLYAAALLALLFVDWRTRYVYHLMAFPVLGAALLLTPLVSGSIFWQGLAGAAVGATVFAVIYLVGRWLYRGVAPMGAGDITLAAIMGAMLGLERVVAGLLLAALLGAGFGLAFAVRYRSVKVSMPYGPSLCLATLALLVVSW